MPELKPFKINKGGLRSLKVRKHSNFLCEIEN